MSKILTIKEKKIIIILILLLSCFMFILSLFLPYGYERGRFIAFTCTRYSCSSVYATDYDSPIYGQEYLLLMGGWIGFILIIISIFLILINKKSGEYLYYLGIILITINTVICIFSIFSVYWGLIIYIASLGILSLLLYELYKFDFAKSGASMILFFIIIGYILIYLAILGGAYLIVHTMKFLFS